MTKQEKTRHQKYAGQENIEEKIMKDIKQGNLKARSKYIFMAGKLGLSSAFAMSIIFAIIFFNLGFFYIRATDNLEYLNFGQDGVMAFLESFPYLLVISFIVFLVLANYLISKKDFSYKKPFKYIIIGSVLFVFVTGGVLAYTNVSEKIEKEIYNKKAGFLLRPLLDRGQKLRSRGMAGIISEINKNDILVKTPVGLQKVNIEKLSDKQKDSLAQDSLIIVIGIRDDDNFYAQEIKIINQKKLPIINREIKCRFEEICPHNLPLVHKEGCPNCHK